MSRPLPYMSVPTVESKHAFLRRAYAGGLKWCGLPLAEALRSPEGYDADWTHIYLDHQKRMYFAGPPWGDNTSNGRPVTLMNSAAQFVAYARTL